MALEVCVRVFLLLLIAFGQHADALSYRTDGDYSAKKPLSNLSGNMVDPQTNKGTQTSHSLPSSLKKNGLIADAQFGGASLSNTGTNSVTRFRNSQSVSTTHPGGGSRQGISFSFKPTTLTSRQPSLIQEQPKFQTLPEASHGILQTKAGMWDVASAQEGNVFASSLQPTHGFEQPRDNRRFLTAEPQKPLDELKPVWRQQDPSHQKPIQKPTYNEQVPQQPSYQPKPVGQPSQTSTLVYRSKNGRRNTGLASPASSANSGQMAPSTQGNGYKQWGRSSNNRPTPQSFHLTPNLELANSATKGGMWNTGSRQGESVFDFSVQPFSLPKVQKTSEQANLPKPLLQQFVNQNAIQQPNNKHFTQQQKDSKLKPSYQDESGVTQSRPSSSYKPELRYSSSNSGIPVLESYEKSPQTGLSDNFGSSLGGSIYSYKPIQLTPEEPSQIPKFALSQMVTGPNQGIIQTKAGMWDIGLGQEGKVFGSSVHPVSSPAYGIDQSSNQPRQLGHDFKPEPNVNLETKGGFDTGTTYRGSSSFKPRTPAFSAQQQPGYQQVAPPYLPDHSSMHQPSYASQKPPSFWPKEPARNLKQWSTVIPGHYKHDSNKFTANRFGRNQRPNVPLWAEGQP